MSYLDIGIRTLRNRTTEVIAAVESGERVTLTVRGDPVADIVPRGRRMRWLSGERVARELAERSPDPIPIGEAIMDAWAQLVSDYQTAGIQQTVKLTDALIAATAIERGLPVVTQEDDFEMIASAHPQLTVARV